MIANIKFEKLQRVIKGLLQGVPLDFCFTSEAKPNAIPLQSVIPSRTLYHHYVLFNTKILRFPETGLRLCSAYATSHALPSHLITSFPMLQNCHTQDGYPRGARKMADRCACKSRMLGKNMGKNKWRVHEPHACSDVDLCLSVNGGPEVEKVVFCRRKVKESGWRKCRKHVVFFLRLLGQNTFEVFVMYRKWRMFV